jgi:YHS domain-containing protein
MDSVLQAKYPELKSFKAFDKNNSLNTVRIDCDGQQTRFMITYNGKIYYIEPVAFSGRTYYACYAKDDANFIKNNFER